MSSIHRFQSTWRQTTFNPHRDNSGITDNPANLNKLILPQGYLELDSVDVNRVSAQDYRELRQYLEGAEPNEAFEGIRAINATGRIIGGVGAGGAENPAANLEDRAWLLNEQFSIAACRLAAMAADPKGVLPYSFRRMSAAGTKQLRFYARPGPARPIWVGRRTEGYVRPMSFQLIAFDPFAYDEALTQDFVNGFNDVITNPGNIYTNPKIGIVFAGAGHAALTITNSTTGKSLVLNATAAVPSEAWVIDVARGTIVEQGGSAENEYRARVSGFVTDLWLQPGANAIAVTNASNVSSVQFDFRGAYA